MPRLICCGSPCCRTGNWSRRSTARGRCSKRPTWSRTCGRCPPTCAGVLPGSSREEVRALQRADPQAWTVSDLPLLDAARQRLGDPETSRRRRRQEAAVASQREQMARVIDELIAADDSELLLMTSLRQQDLRDALIDQDALPSARVPTAGPAGRPVRARRGGRGAGTDRRAMADVVAALPVPQLHHRRRPSSGQARVHRVLAGTARADRAEPDQPRLAEHQLPDAGRGDGRGRTGHPGGAAGCQRADLDPQHRRAGPARNPAELGTIVDAWLAEHAEGIACVISADRRFRQCPRPPRVRSLTPELSKGLEFDLVVLRSNPARTFGGATRHRGSGRPLCRDDPGDPATRHPHELTAAVIIKHYALTSWSDDANDRPDRTAAGSWPMPILWCRAAQLIDLYQCHPADDEHRRRGSGSRPATDRAAARRTAPRTAPRSSQRTMSSFAPRTRAAAMPEV